MAFQVIGVVGGLKIEDLSVARPIFIAVLFSVAGHRAIAQEARRTREIVNLKVLQLQNNAFNF